MKDVEQLETPDWPIELEAPVAQLGQPTDVFRIPRRHALNKAMAGMTLIIGGGIANYVYWVVFNGPLVGEHLLFFLLFGPIVSGIGLIYGGIRDRGLWVLVYPMGLLRWQRGEVVTFPWADVSELAFYRVVECDRPRRQKGPNGEIVSVWLPIAKMGSRTLGAHLILRRDDGAEAILPSSIGDFTRLCRLVQEETFREIWPRVWRRFAEGSRVQFGDLAISIAGVHRDADLLPWYDLDDALIQNSKIVLRSKKLRSSWIELPLQNLPNPHVFAALLYVCPLQAATDAFTQVPERDLN